MIETHDLRKIARALGGDVAGCDTVLAPGPGHSARDRSLAVRLDHTAPDGFLVHSHAGDDWRACRDHVRERLGLPAWEAGDGRRRTIPQRHVDKWDLAAIETEVNEGPRAWNEDELLRIAPARRIWNEAQDPRRTLGERYLRDGRKLDLPGEMAGSVLRFHPRCPWRDENTGQTIFIPALIAAFVSIDDDSITAVHRIRVDQPGRWPKTERRMLGIVHRAAVKLDALSGDTLTIAEGIETGMAARQLGFKPTWALGSVGAISFFPLIDGLLQLTILGEVGEASARAIKFSGTRWRRAGRRVRVVMPNDGLSDMNDALIAEGSAS
jgi:putative DNA primase/helicase